MISSVIYIQNSFKYLSILRNQSKIFKYNSKHSHFSKKLKKNTKRALILEIQNVKKHANAAQKSQQCSYIYTLLLFVV